jgi:ketosteroid isomerase-like protein
MIVPDPRDVRALDKLREQLRLAEETGDASLLHDVYSDDVIIMAPYSPTIQGRAACLEFAQALLASLASEFERQVDATSSELLILGDLAIDRGTFAQTLFPRAGGAPIYESGRYLWIHSRSDDGRWRARRIIWNMETSSDDEPSDHDG